MNWTVHKFGGTSLADAEMIQRVKDIVLGQADRGPTAVIVSAMAGFTDRFHGLVQSAQDKREDWRDDLADIVATQVQTAEQLLSGASFREFVSLVTRDRKTIEDVLHATVLTGSAAPTGSDFVVGFGEIWSASLLSLLLGSELPNNNVEFVNARDVLAVSKGELGPVVDWDVSRHRLETKFHQAQPDLVVITGYIASDENDLPTTLGRNGSDFSASIFANLLAAREMHIWTDVDGVMSADPRRVPEATVVDTLSYSEAMELAYFGASVIHPQTMAPVIATSTPIHIRNTWNPEHPGTCISEAKGLGQAVKGVTSIDGVALINLEGTGMIGVPGTAHRLFEALSKKGVSVILISQGSSEHSICFAVPDEVAEIARGAVAQAFRLEIQEKQIETITVTKQCSIVAVVGDGMSGTPGVAAKTFDALGSVGVNILAIAQGSSERNISAVIEKHDVSRAVQAIHARFYLSKHTLSIGMIGRGNVGGTLLDQLASECERLRNESNLDIRVRGITTTKSMLLKQQGVLGENWRQQVDDDAVPLDLDQFLRHIRSDSLPHAVIVDCSASQDIAMRYTDWLSQGVHVVTPNKKANSDSLDYYQQIKQSKRNGNAHLLYETTVGAGLPIIQTLNDLRQTGDDIHRIEGIFSGTLAYLFHHFDGSKPFSMIVKEALAAGYTEPDPRDDLSGMDVARKLTILGREMGLDLELADIDLHGLVPTSLEACSVEDFLSGLSDFDDEIAHRVIEAKESNSVLRFVGRLQADGSASAKLELVAADHLFARIAETDNVVQFVTSRYLDNPLVVQGPGAGPDVTAGGVFADLLRLSAYLGANF